MIEVPRNRNPMAKTRVKFVGTISFADEGGFCIGNWLDEWIESIE